MERQLGKKLITSHTFSGTFPCLESPLCSEDGRAVGNPKGWYSERVPYSGYRAQKGYVAKVALMPFSSGRALPSKWDDAERWISSPVSLGNVSCSGNSFYGPGVHTGSYSAHNAQRRAKSKSGPLGPPGFGSYGGYNTFSPVLSVGVINGGKWRNSLESPAVVMEGLDGGGEDGRRRSCPGHGDPEWLDLWGGPLSPSDKRDENLDNNGFKTNLSNDGFESINDGENDNNNDCNDEGRVDRVISRRDMATQMYPESESSTPSAYSPSPLLNEANYMNVQSNEFDVRDVQIDRQTSRTTQRPSSQENEAIQNFSYSTTTIVDEDTKMFKLQREKARINAWENLQKAKAESAIQKLEMKLEKKRVSSMEKIIEKLRRAEIKAQKMRGSLADDSDHVKNRALLKTTTKISLFCRKIRTSSSTRTCSTCYPF